MPWPYTYTRVATPKRGVIVAFTVRDGVTNKGRVEQFIDRAYGVLGPGTVKRNRRWRAIRPSGKVVGAALFNRDSAAKKL